MLNPDDVIAIDIHTHAEEPCGAHGDDGYDDFQAAMSEYFKSPHKHPPTVPETAAYYRSEEHTSELQSHKALSRMPSSA